MPKKKVSKEKRHHARELALHFYKPGIMESDAFLLSSVVDNHRASSAQCVDAPRASLIIEDRGFRIMEQGA
jgi:hypothetical protein